MIAVLPAYRLRRRCQCFTGNRGVRVAGVTSKNVLDNVGSVAASEPAAYRLQRDEFTVVEPAALPLTNHRALAQSPPTRHHSNTHVVQPALTALQAYNLVMSNGSTSRVGLW